MENEKQPSSATFSLAIQIFSLSLQWYNETIKYRYWISEWICGKKIPWKCEYLCTNQELTKETYITWKMEKWFKIWDHQNKATLSFIKWTSCCLQNFSLYYSWLCSFFCCFPFFLLYHTLVTFLITHLYFSALISMTLFLGPHVWAVTLLLGTPLWTMLFKEPVYPPRVPCYWEQFSQPVGTCISVVHDQLSSAEIEKVVCGKVSCEESEEPGVVDVATVRKAQSTGLGF